MLPLYIFHETAKVRDAPEVEDAAEEEEETDSSESDSSDDSSDSDVDEWAMKIQWFFYRWL